MTAFSAVWMLLIASVAIFPMLALQKRQRVTRWDWVYPFTGVVAWVPIAVARIGSTVSLSNFVVEVFWIGILSAAIPWVRLFLSRIEGQWVKRSSDLLTLLPMIAAVIIRLTMPTLPE